VVSDKIKMNKTMKCDLCKKTFGEKEKGKLNRHKKLAHDFACHNCNSMFVDDMDLKTHLRENHGVRVGKYEGMNNYAYECRKCLKQSKTFGSNIKHEQMEHLHKCQICIDKEVAFPFSFIDKNGLKRHTVTMHINGEMEEAILQKSSEEDASFKGKDSDDNVIVVAVMPKLVKDKRFQHVHVKDEDLPVDYSEYIINETIPDDEGINEVSPNDKIKEKSFLASKSSVYDENANKLTKSVIINQSKTVENPTIDVVKCNRENNVTTEDILCTPDIFCTPSSKPVPKPPPNRSVLIISPVESISIPATALPAFSDIHSEFDVTSVTSDVGNLERIDKWVDSTLKEEAEVVPMEDPEDQNLRGNTEIKVVEVDGILMVQERYAIRMNSAALPEQSQVSPLGLEGNMLTPTQDPQSVVCGKEKSPVMDGLWNQNLFLINENSPANIGPPGRGRARVRGGVRKTVDDNHISGGGLKVIIPNISKKLQHSVPVNVPGGIDANTGQGPDGGEVSYRSSLITSTPVAQAMGTPRETPSPPKEGVPAMAVTSGMGVGSTSPAERGVRPMRPMRGKDPTGVRGGAPPRGTQRGVRMRGAPGGPPVRGMRGTRGGPLVRGVEGTPGGSHLRGKRPRMPMGPHVMGDASGMRGAKLMGVRGAPRGSWPDGLSPANPFPPVNRVDPTPNPKQVKVEDVNMESPPPTGTPCSANPALDRLKHCGISVSRRKVPTIPKGLTSSSQASTSYSAAHINSQVSGGSRSHSTQPTIERIQPTIGSIQPTIRSIQPTINSTQPTIESTQPTIESTQPTIERIQPTIESIQPTIGSIQPTIESIQPTIRTIQPTIATIQPTVTDAQAPSDNSTLNLDTLTPEQMYQLRMLGII